ncbi:DUF2799 domain-containing protein [Aliivibrio sp. S4TY2]|uniref:DUF2799 domain-containing protein n=1 Tax=unclassified Aliivibrio TaxID=2645654 RepID=UPI0023794070|nr:MULTISPECIES: DUF2799 domain-containing protein [unclassified Aliivibrio]MDD9156929.1 DUF2799 domain-containing protein [Aliivibrio sp. S4TY2]MDD9160857.1 DUF2799 domain-containing protein [Aliivibrio sp. S4TY1]MDD9164886.1 DUF2799 domain-containing protein [Aliivibrio sp. S4MY2]MDD9168839.1 DUF2799 domain-containing protein [Aliivibrio sp. S4MY4]MDD9185367.1 DUF2799 domain-containing protein [Aliivibrio sp. S4MY3]
MKQKVVSLMMLLLVGCTASQSEVKEKNTDDWFQYGEQRAKNGFLVQEKETLESVKPEEEVTEAFYNAYLEGHTSGTTIYCSQEAYILGLREAPYFGICDQIMPDFRAEYEKGKNHKKE